MDMARVRGHVTGVRSRVMGVEGHVSEVCTSSEGVGTDQAGLPSFPLVEISQLQEARRSVGQTDSRGRYNTVLVYKGGARGLKLYLGAGCGFAAALQTHKHDDVVLSLSGSPGLHTGVHQLQHNNTHQHQQHTAPHYDTLQKPMI